MNALEKANTIETVEIYNDISPPPEEEDMSEEVLVDEDLGGNEALRLRPMDRLYRIISSFYARGYKYTDVVEDHPALGVMISDLASDLDFSYVVGTTSIFFRMGSRHIEMVDRLKMGVLNFKAILFNHLSWFWNVPVSNYAMVYPVKSSNASPRIEGCEHYKQSPIALKLVEEKPERNISVGMARLRNGKDKVQLVLATPEGLMAQSVYIFEIGKIVSEVLDVHGRAMIFVRSVQDWVRVVREFPQYPCGLAVRIDELSTHYYTARDHMCGRDVQLISTFSNKPDLEESRIKIVDYFHYQSWSLGTAQFLLRHLRGYTHVNGIFSKIPVATQIALLRSHFSCGNNALVIDTECYPHSSDPTAVTDWCVYEFPLSQKIAEGTSKDDLEKFIVTVGDVLWLVKGAGRELKIMNETQSKHCYRKNMIVQCTGMRMSGLMDIDFMISDKWQKEGGKKHYAERGVRQKVDLLYGLLFPMMWVPYITSDLVASVLPFRSVKQGLFLLEFKSSWESTDYSTVDEKESYLFEAPKLCQLKEEKFETEELYEQDGVVVERDLYLAREVVNKCFFHKYAESTRYGLEAYHGLMFASDVRDVFMGYHNWLNFQKRVIQEGDFWSNYTSPPPPPFEYELVIYGDDVGWRPIYPVVPEFGEGGRRGDLDHKEFMASSHKTLADVLGCLIKRKRRRVFEFATVNTWYEVMRRGLGITS